MCAKQIMRTALWKYLHPFPVMITLITETKCSTLWLLAAATTISLKHIPSVVESDTTTLPPTPPNKNPCHKYSNKTTSIYQEHTWSRQYSMSSQINKIKLRQQTDNAQNLWESRLKEQIVILSSPTIPATANPTSLLINHLLCLLQPICSL